jgi:hypothetical protein
MNTAQEYYELYKTLPKKVKREVLELISYEDERVPLKRQLEEGLREIKLIREGKLKATPAREFLKELKQELSDEV